MKKNGFTLVELLAVIAILAILVVLVLPNVLEMYRGSRKKAFVSEVQSVYKTMEGDLITKTMRNAGNEYTGTYTNVSGCHGYSKGNSELAIMNSDIEYYIEIADGKVTTFIAQNDEYYTKATLATEEGKDNLSSDDTVNGEKVQKREDKTNPTYNMTTSDCTDPE